MFTSIKSNSIKTAHAEKNIAIKKAKKHSQVFFVVLLLLLISFLSACTNTDPGDGAPRVKDIDLDRIPSATPKDEVRSKYGNPASYSVRGKTYFVKDSSEGYVERGKASWYGTKFHGRRTSSGVPYDMYLMTAAHKTLPLPTYVEVENLDNGKTIIVKVNDRGPFHAGRIIDLSYVAALKLGVVKAGTANVEVRTIGRGPSKRVKKTSASLPFFVQVGSFTDKDNAAKMQLTLSQAQIESDIHKMMMNARKPIYRVRIGPFKKRSDTRKVLNTLGDIGITDVKVLTGKK